MTRISNVSTKVLSACIALMTDYLPKEVPNKEEIAIFVAQTACSVESDATDSTGTLEFSLIKMRRSHQDAVSCKPFNIIVNWRRLIEASPAMALTVIGSTTNIWMLLLAGLTLMCQIRGLTEIQLTRYHAVLLEIIAQNENASMERIYNLFIGQDDKIDTLHAANLFDACFDELKKIKAIKIIENKIQLVERIAL